MALVRHLLLGGVVEEPIMSPRFPSLMVVSHVCCGCSISCYSFLLVMILMCASTLCQVVLDIFTSTQSGLGDGFGTWAADGCQFGHKACLANTRQRSVATTTTSLRLHPRPHPRPSHLGQRCRWTGVVVLSRMSGCASALRMGRSTTTPWRTGTCGTTLMCMGRCANAPPRMAGCATTSPWMGRSATLPS